MLRCVGHIITTEPVTRIQRYMKTFKGYIKNRACAEGCIVEAYIAEEAVECLVNNEEVTIGVPKRAGMSRIPYANHYPVQRL